MTKKEYTERLISQGMYLYEHEAWVHAKVDSLRTMEEKTQFLTASAVYALSKVGIEIPE